MTDLAESNVVADVSKVALRHRHLGGGDIGTRAHGVVVLINLAMRIVDQNVRSRVAVRITPNGEPLVCERPVESVVLSRRLAREILFVSPRGSPQSDLQQDRSR